MNLSEIGLKIRELKKQKGITQNELAKKSGISRATLSKVENGFFQKYQPQL